MNDEWAVRDLCLNSISKSLSIRIIRVQILNSFLLFSLLFFIKLISISNYIYQITLEKISNFQIIDISLSTFQLLLFLQFFLITIKITVPFKYISAWKIIPLSSKNYSFKYILLFIQIFFQYFSNLILISQWK